MRLNYSFRRRLARDIGLAAAVGWDSKPELLSWRRRREPPLSYRGNMVFPQAHMDETQKKH